MPSSYEHCRDCQFESIPLSNDYVVPVIEEIVILNALYNLQFPDHKIPLAPIIRKQGVDASHELAAKSCASLIFNDECPKYIFKPSPNHGRYEIVERSENLR